jgi:hypothetical protein
VTRYLIGGVFAVLALALAVGAIRGTDPVLLHGCRSHPRPADALRGDDDADNGHDPGDRSGTTSAGSGPTVPVGAGARDLSNSPASPRSSLTMQSHDFSDLRALFVNCTLKRSPQLSHTDGLMAVSKAIMARHGVQIDELRAVDHRIAPPTWTRGRADRRTTSPNATPRS